MSDNAPVSPFQRDQVQRDVARAVDVVNRARTVIENDRLFVTAAGSAIGRALADAVLTGEVGADTPVLDPVVNDFTFALRAAFAREMASRAS